MSALQLATKVTRGVIPADANARLDMADELIRGMRKELQSLQNQLAVVSDLVFTARRYDL